MLRSLRHIACGMAIALLSVASVGGQDFEILQNTFDEARRLHDAGRLEEALPHSRNAARWGVDLLDDQPGAFARILTLHGIIAWRLGHFGEAEDALSRALAIDRDASGPRHLETASDMYNLASLYMAQGRYGDAEPLLRTSLKILNELPGSGARLLSPTASALGQVYEAMGRYGEAESQYARALEIVENGAPLDLADLALSLDRLAVLYHRLSRLDEAELLQVRATEAAEQAFGKAHTHYATLLTNLASVYVDQGRYADAKSLSQSALAIYRAEGAADSIQVAANLNNLAKLYHSRGRYTDAVPLLERALAIYERRLGVDSPQFAATLSSLGVAQLADGLVTEAATSLERALSLREKLLGAEHPELATSLNNVAQLHMASGFYDRAEALFQRALTIAERRFGAGSAGIAVALSNLAGLYVGTNRIGDAEPLYRRALALWQGALGPDHPLVARAADNLAFLYRKAGRMDEALVFARSATAITKSHLEREATAAKPGSNEEIRSVRHRFMLHVALAAAGNRMGAAAPDKGLVAEAFEVGQLARSSSAARAMAQMTARYATLDSALAALVRERQDALERWYTLDRELLGAVSEIATGGGEDAGRLRVQLWELDQRIQEIESRLAREFPDYAALAKPQVVSIESVKGLLRPREALVAYLIGTEESFVWVVRRNGAAMRRIDMGRTELEGAVEDLRWALDLANAEQLQPFPVARAHALYRKIWVPIEELLDGADHVLLVPDGPLQSLPPAVLVTEAPKAGEGAAYAQQAWLATKYAISILPAVSSLAALRRIAAVGVARQPFAGFGDPAFEGGPGATRKPAVANLFSRRSVADVRQVQYAAPLPDTAAELRALARAVRGDPRHVYLRRQATERRVRTMDLSDFRILAFATHGIMAGEFAGIAEPGLLLTPPSEGSESDDGVLTASEIAGLDLNAELVVLSACNTAAPDGTPGAEGLSGLAKAFFYAGSRTLLVSHWAVESRSATFLTTHAFAQRAAHPTFGWAEALRQAMLSLLADHANPRNAHPALWAPFVVVGEGGA